jgi:uncharacterized membrane protein YebE (DUF533 family)
MPRMSEVESESESQVLTVLRLWAAIAWADGVLANAEAEGLRRLIEGTELTDEDRRAAMKLLDAPVSLPDSYVLALTPEVRRGIYRAGCRIAVVDHMVTAKERNMLDRLRDLLDLPEDVAAAVESEIPGLA